MALARWDYWVVGGIFFFFFFGGGGVDHFVVEMNWPCNVIVSTIMTMTYQLTVSENIWRYFLSQILNELSTIFDIFKVRATLYNTK